MSTTPNFVQPPELDGFPSPTLLDAFRIVGWTIRGFAHGTRHASPRAALLLLIVIVFAPVVLPVMLVTQIVVQHRRDARYYLSRHRDAALCVVATRDCWTLTDHTSRRPGQGQGAALRADLLPRLLPAADQLQIVTHTRTPQLATAYQRDVPGLAPLDPDRRVGTLLRPALTPPDTPIHHTLATIAAHEDRVFRLQWRSRGSLGTAVDTATIMLGPDLADDDEDVQRFVVAHEIGHLLDPDPLRRPRWLYLASGIVILAGATADFTTENGYTLLLALAAGLPLLVAGKLRSASTQRAREHAADNYAATHGYPATPEVVQHIQTTEGPLARLLGPFRTHPLPEKRASDGCVIPTESCRSGPS